MSRTAAIAVTALFSLALAAPSGVATQLPVSFKGKTITMLVGAEPGGGTDASGRLIARVLGKYLPGEPNIIIQNMPGASGIVSVNHFVRRTQPDGLTVLMGTNSTVDPIVYRNLNAQFDPKQIPMVGGIARGGTVIFITSRAEPQLYDKSAAAIVIGTIAGMPRVAMQPALWCIEYLGWNAKWVTGYRGTNEVMIAFDRGEVDMTSTGNIFQIQDRLSSGHLKIVNQSGMFENGRFVSRAGFGDAPLFPDQMKGRINDPVARKAFDYWSALASADKWLGVAPGTPADVLETYREAFRKTVADKELVEQAERISDGFAPMAAPDVESVVRTLADTPPEALDYIRGLMRKQGLRTQ
jgi:tripartite-type tricarboxylate transporter receptor subunit TctC